MSVYAQGHAPTETDYLHAMMYAEDVLTKQACLARPDKYVWVESGTTRYPCPQGLECASGQCRFKDRSACLSEGELPYYDCVRKTVECDTDPSGQCHICDYTISTGKKIEGPFIPEEEAAEQGCYAGDPKYRFDKEYPLPETTSALTESGFCDFDSQCAQGWSCVGAEPEAVFDQQGAPCTSDDQCGGGRSVCSPESGVCVADVMYEGMCVTRCAQDADCGANLGEGAVCGTDPRDAALYGRCYMPTEDPEEATGEDENPRLCVQKRAARTPYTVKMYDNEGGNSDEAVARSVSCSSDLQCAVPPGVGGKCGLDPNSPTYGLCYDPYTKPYLEWRDEVQLWSGVPTSKNVCIETLPEGRKWCEMPWTRAATHEKSGNVSLPLQDRVKAGWKSKARPPFWYNEADGTCHVTRSYCKANLKDGGFSTGYGRGVDAWLFSDCVGDASGEVVGAYDCCTTAGDSVGQFFLGRTLATDFNELFGDGDFKGFGERWKSLAYERTRLKDAVEGYMELGEQLTAANPDFEPTYTVDTVGEAIDMLCDPRLKAGLRRVASYVFAPGVEIHGYEWTWNPVAQRLYGKYGNMAGLLTSEVAHYFPSLVQSDANGYNHISVLPEAFPEHRRLGSIMAAFKRSNDLATCFPAPASTQTHTQPYGHHNHHTQQQD